MVAVISESLVFLLPETKGTKLPDTMEDAVAIVKLVDHCLGIVTLVIIFVYRYGKYGKLVSYVCV